MGTGALARGRNAGEGRPSPSALAGTVLGDFPAGAENAG